MSFTRANPVGWAINEVLTSAQMNQVDLNQSRALDGNAGGSYSPSADLDFPGANNIRWGATRWPKLTSRTVSRVQPLALFFSTAVGGTADFLTVSNGTPEAHVSQQDVSAAIACTFELSNLVDLATLAAVRIYLQPFAGSTAATKPAIRVIKTTTTGSSWLTASKTDDYGGTYTDAHSFQITSIGEAIDESTASRYFLRFDGEQGAGALVGLKIFSIVCDFTTTLVTPGG